MRNTPPTPRTHKEFTREGSAKNALPLIHLPKQNPPQATHNPSHKHRPKQNTRPLHPQHPPTKRGKHNPPPIALPKDAMGLIWGNGGGDWQPPTNLQH